MKKQIELRDFLDFKFISNLSFSPNEEYGAFVVSTCDEDKNNYRSYLYSSDGDNYRQLTSYGKESLYIWDNNETILFANMRDEEDRKAVEKGEERTVFYRIHLHGGEAVKAFTLPFFVTAIKKVKDGTYLFSADFHMRYSTMYQVNDEQKKALLKEKKDMQDYEVLDELPFYGNGLGYINSKRNSLFLYEESTDEITRISEETMDVSDFEITEDGSIVYYVGEAYSQKPLSKDGVYQYNIVNKTSKEILTPEVYSVKKLFVWDKDLYVLASDQKMYGMNENGKFYHLGFDGTMILFADYEDSIGSSVGSDCRYGGGKSVQIYGDKLYFITTVYNRSVVYALDKDGHISSVYDNEGSVDAIAIAKGKLYFIGMQDMRLQEVYCFDMETKTVQQITTLNEHFFEEKDIRPCIPCNIKQGDMEIYGWVLTPSNYDENKTYPAILDIHGGPKTVYGEVYYHEMQVWANMGYFVFFMNPRGGDGRGNSFADIRGKYGTIDYDDLMKFTDEVLKQYPAIDASQVGVTGGSYGGFMTNWIITHTNRFKAAASQRSISNWISFAHTSDIGDFFAKDQQAADTWSNVEKLWWHSPLKYADQCKTPTLFIHSNEDYRCPYSEGLQMYSALCAHGVETRLCMFKGENHELSRSGKPRHRVKRLEEISNWMHHYLIQK